jgi:hypothetical protein
MRATQWEKAMRVVRGAATAHATRAERLEALCARSQAWLARHDVRMALAALALRLAVVPAAWLAHARPALRVGYMTLAPLVWIIFLSEWVFWSWAN